jgi:hypothetical protein
MFLNGLGIHWQQVEGISLFLHLTCYCHCYSDVNEGEKKESN